MTKVFDKDGVHIGYSMDGLTVPKIRRMKRALWRKITKDDLQFEDVEVLCYLDETKVLCQKIGICNKSKFNDFKNSP